MASLFDKDPSQKDPLPAYATERIEKEIAHLKKKGSTRQGADERKTFAKLICFLAVVGFIWLFVMDPFLYAYYKGNAIRAYLYLHNYGDDAKAAQLQTYGILSSDDVAILNEKQGSFTDYFVGATPAKATVDDAVAYMKGVTDLRTGHYVALSPLNKVRYTLFFHFGLSTPEQWGILNPKVEPDQAKPQPDNN